MILFVDRQIDNEHVKYNYTTIYRRFGGSIPGNRFRFRFVFVSCVRASGRGEAVWARDVCPPNAGPKVRKKSAPACTFFWACDTCFTVEMLVFAGVGGGLEVRFLCE